MADFEALKSKYDEEQIAIIAGSVDPIDKAKETAGKAKVTFPVAYGMDAEKVSEITGAYFDDNRKYLHATGFIIRLDNTVEVAAYSSGPVGRFVSQDVLGLIKFYKSKMKKS